MPDQLPEISFGDIWVHLTAGTKLPYLVVSGETYNALDEDNAIAVPVRPGSDPRAVVEEHLPDVGVAQLDRLQSLSRSSMVERIGELGVDRHGAVTRRLRNLIGV